MDGNYISAVQLTRPLPEGSYLRGLPAVRYLLENRELRFPKPVTFFVGENGTGKSTLLEGIAVAYGFNPEGGTRNFTFSTRATHSELYRSLTLVRRAYASDGFFLRAESLYNLASNIDDMDGAPSPAPRVVDSYGGVSLHRQSHGESCLAVVRNRFGGNGLYLLDEPEAALSPASQMALLAALHRLVEKNSQFIVATHSPILMAYPGARIYELTPDGVHTVDYRETEHYQLTRRFLENPEKMTRILFGET